MNWQEVNQTSAEELLDQLKKVDVVSIGSGTYELWEITDMLDIGDLRDAAQEAIFGYIEEINALYIKQINKLMGE